MSFRIYFLVWFCLNLYNTHSIPYLFFLCDRQYMKNPWSLDVLDFLISFTKMDTKKIPKVRKSTDLTQKGLLIYFRGYIISKYISELAMLRSTSKLSDKGNLSFIMDFRNNFHFFLSLHYNK
jgi:hypothetical protein